MRIILCHSGVKRQLSEGVVIHCDGVPSLSCSLLPTLIQSNDGVYRKGTPRYLEYQRSTRADGIDRTDGTSRALP